MNRPISVPAEEMPSDISYSSDFLRFKSVFWIDPERDLGVLGSMIFFGIKPPLLIDIESLTPFEVEFMLIREDLTFDC